MRCNRCGKRRPLYRKNPPLDPSLAQFWEYQQGDFCKRCLEKMTERALFAAAKVGTVRRIWPSP